MHWISGEWEHCSATCGSEGIQFRLVSCVRIIPSKQQALRNEETKENIKSLLANENLSNFDPYSKFDTSLMNSDESLVNNILSKNTTKNDINYIDNMSKEKTFETLKYNLNSNDVRTVGFEYVDPSLCIKEEKPISERPCNRISCSVYWQQSGWTEVRTFTNQIHYAKRK